VKPAPFDLACPDTVDEALEVLAEHGADARILAGGQSLGAMLNMRLATPGVLIDISRLDELTTITETDRLIEVGAAVTQDQLLRWPGLAAQPLLRQMLPWVGHHQTRQRGTVCGSLAHGDPSSELPLALATLGGEVVLASRRSRRVVSARDFQIGLMQTALEDDEMIVAARFPKAPKGARFAFHEVGPRQGDFAIVAVAVMAEPDGSGAEGMTIGIGGVADTPAVRRVVDLEGAALADALNGIAWELQAGSDVHATASYRRTLVRNLGAKVIGEAGDALSQG
jgi:2-furoyl-CoA dehydrogenase FAD binding subunit